MRKSEKDCLMTSFRLLTPALCLVLSLWVGPSLHAQGRRESSDTTGVSQSDSVRSRNLFPDLRKAAASDSSLVGAASPAGEDPLLREDNVSTSPDDTTATLILKDAVVSSRKELPIIENKAGLSGTVNVEMIKSIPSFLGNSDPLRFARLLPSIQVNSETEGGLYMQGSEYSHTLIAIQGVPLYGTTHLLGLFSVFNAPHYKEMHYSTSAGTENRLGGFIELTLQDTLSRRVSGEISAGLLSAQGTLRFPVGSKSSLILSARKSYINLLYGSFLKYGDNPLNYGFMDGNLTWLWKPTPNDRIWVDLFADRDDGSFLYNSATSVGKATWYNMLASVHWRHVSGDVTLHQTLYGTRNGLEDLLDIGIASGELPSHMMTFGYKATVKWQDWTFGGDVAYHQAQPQNPIVRGLHNQRNNAGIPSQDGLESKLTAQWKKILGMRFEVEAGLGVSHYLSPERESFFHVSPHINIQYNAGYDAKVALRYDFPVQNLFQTGLTGAGLPWEFWFLAGKFSAPQYSHNFSLSYNHDLPGGEYSLSAELYYKKLYNQVEYNGSLMEFLNSEYRLEDCLLKGSGHAYGVNLMVQKQKGPLTGWIGYAYGRTMRSFDDAHFEGLYPSNHDRPHELNVVATYDWGKVDVGGTFVAASGIPYTRPLSFYIMNDTMVCNYGAHNGSRIPPYIRLDLSVNWYFHRGPRGENGLNFALYNALGRENPLGAGIHMSSDKSSFEFHTVSFGIKFLPSLAYFHKF